MSVSFASAEAGSPFNSEPRTRSPPKYKITRVEDDTLQWEPPIRSRELANALSYHYPLEQTLQEKMQRAILDFLDSEVPPVSASSKDIGTGSRPPVAAQDQKFVSIKNRTGTGLLQPTGNTTPQLPSNHSPEVFGVWDIKTGEFVKPKGRKRGLSPTTRQRVAENRGNTCAFHRKAKTQCDPTQCRQNKLYPGTGVESGSAKGADQRKRPRKDESPSESSEILDWTIGVGGSQPLKRVKELTSQPLNMQKAVKRLEGESTPFSGQDRNGTSFKPSHEEESGHNSLSQFSGVNSFLPEGITLADINAYHAWYLDENMFSTFPGSQRIPEGAENFYSTSNMDSNRELGPVAMKEIPFEPDIDLQGDWIATEETFGVGHFDWIKDLMPSDLPSLEYDWPREEACATATLSDLSSSPYTLFDFCDFNFEVAEVVRGDSQGERRFHNLEDVDRERYAVDGVAATIPQHSLQAVASILPSRSPRPSPVALPSSAINSKLTPYGSTFVMPSEVALEPSEAEGFNSLIGAEGFAALTSSALHEMPRGARRRRCADFEDAPPAAQSKNTQKSSKLGGGLSTRDSRVMSRRASSLVSLAESASSRLQSEYTRGAEMVSNMAVAGRAGEATFSVPGGAIAAEPNSLPGQIPISSHELEKDGYPLMMYSFARKSGTQPDTSLSKAAVAELEAPNAFESAGAVNHKPQQGLESNDSASSLANAVISIEDLTALLRNSSLRFTGLTEEIYTPKDEQPLADIILLDDANSKTTPALSRDALRDVLKTSRSRVRLIRSICSVNLETTSKKRSSNEISPGTMPSMLESSDVAVDGIYDQESGTSDVSRYKEYIKFLCDQCTTNHHPSGERLVKLIYSSAATGTLVNHVMVAPVKLEVSGPSPLPASYSLRWPCPDWQSLESVMSDIKIQKSLSVCGLVGGSESRFERRSARSKKVSSNLPLESGTTSLNKERPHKLRQPRQTSDMAMLTSEKPLTLSGAGSHTRHRSPKKKLLVLLGKPVDAAKSLWKKLSELKL